MDGKLQIFQDGSAHLSVLGDDESVHIQTSANYSAVISARKGKVYHEVSVSNSATSAAHVVSIITVEDKKAGKRVLTEFANKVIREDIYTVTLDGITRTTEWKYPTGAIVRAEYATGRRSLRIVKETKNSCCDASFETTGYLVGNRLEAVTTSGDDSTGPVSIWGQKVFSQRKTTTLIYHSGLSPDAVDNLSASMISKSGDGTTSSTQIHGFGSNSISSYNTTIDESGGQIQSYQRIVLDSSGNTSSSPRTIQTQDNGDGTITVTISQGIARTDGAGSISSRTASISTTFDSNGNIISQFQNTSSWTVDSQGVQTQIDTTIGDGTYLTTITVTAPDGTSTSQTAGIQPPGIIWTGGDDTGGGVLGGGEVGGGNIGEGEGNLGEGDLGGGDAEGEIAAIVVVGADGRFPSDDGTDPTPAPCFPGLADKLFTQFLSGSDVYLGGQLRPLPTSPRHSGATTELKFEDLKSTIVSGPSSPSVELWGARVSLPLLTDPDHLPIASVGILGKLGVVNQASGGMLAATKAAAILSALY